MTNSELSVDVYPIEIPIAFDKSDIVAVAMSEFETKVQTDIAVLERQIVQLEKEVNRGNKQFEELVCEEASKAVKEVELRKAAKALGFDEDCVVVKVQSSWNQDGEAIVHVKVYENSRIPGTNKPKDLTGDKVYYDSYGSNRGIASCITRVVFFKLSKTAKALHSDIESLQLQREKAMEEAISLRSKLCDLPRMERMAKAQLARHALEQTKEGRELLSKIVDIKSLPELVESAGGKETSKKIAKKKTTKKKVTKKKTTNRQ